MVVHIPTNHCTTHKKATHTQRDGCSLEIGCVSQPKIFTVAKKLNIFAQKGAAGNDDDDEVADDTEDEDGDEDVDEDDDDVGAGVDRGEMWAWEW